jgi:hypothetical protein
VCAGFKNPLELHKSVGIAIRELLKKTREDLPVDSGGRLDR